MHVNTWLLYTCTCALSASYIIYYKRLILPDCGDNPVWDHWQLQVSTEACDQTYVRPWTMGSYTMYDSYNMAGSASYICTWYRLKTWRHNVPACLYNWALNMSNNNWTASPKSLETLPITYTQRNAISNSVTKSSYLKLRELLHWERVKVSNECPDGKAAVLYIRGLSGGQGTVASETQLNGLRQTRARPIQQILGWTEHIRLVWQACIRIICCTKACWKCYYIIHHQILYQCGL